MKTYLLTFAMTLFISVHSFSQFKLIAESKKFEEPAYKSRIIQLKNGNTVLLNPRTGGIEVRIYDNNHQEKSVTSFGPSSTLQAVEIRSMIEVKSDVILFISSENDGIPTLTRFIVDGNTGKLKGESVLATSNKRGKMITIGGSFVVKQAELDESYVVAIDHALEADKDKRVEILQYDDNHTQVKKTYLVTGDNGDYKFFVYMDMIVIKADMVKVFLYNGKEKYFYNSKKGRMVMASIDLKETAPVYSTFSNLENIKFYFVEPYYNHATKKLYALASELQHKDNPFSQFYIKIDLLTNKSEVLSFKWLSDEIHQQYRDKYSLKGDYSGYFRQFRVNDDESFSMVFEEIFTYSTTGAFGGSASTSYSGKILVVDYTAKASISKAYFAPKLFIKDTYSPYKEFVYINSGKKSYICFNDTERNNEVKKDKFVEIKAVAELDAFYYPLTGSDIFPKRDYVFGDKEKGHELLSFGISHYDRKNNVIATLRLSKESITDKAVSLVWLQPQ